MSLLHPIDISISAEWPACALSNMAENPFIFEEVACASMEGLLQSFKFADRTKQLHFCGLHGLDAKYGGRAGDGWRATQTLYWDNIPYPRSSTSYQFLLNRAYASLGVGNLNFQRALLESGGAPLTHRIGNPDPTVTILTPDEFTSRLMKLRKVIQGRRAH